MGGLLSVFILWILCVAKQRTQAGTIQILPSSDVATSGSNFTLICVWQPSDGENVTYVNWIGGPTGTTNIRTNITTCAVQIPENNTLNIVIATGYRYQTLTFVNVTQELNGSEWLCVNDQNRSTIRITVEEPSHVTLSPLIPTTWYGSTFTFTCTYVLGSDHNWTSEWYRNETGPKFFLSEKRCVEPNALYKVRCNKYDHVVTVLDVSSYDTKYMWSCSAAKVSSNKVRLTAFLDPGWPDDVELSTPDSETTITETPVTLICSSRCEDENYVFDWNVSGQVSDIDYNSCTSRCTQRIILELNQPCSSYDVNCTVINNRTRKEASAVLNLNITLKPKQVQITMDPESMASQPTAGTQDTKYLYIGTGSAVGVLLIIVCIVVVICCKRRAIKSDEVMMDNILYTSADTKNSPEKPVMEDNVLYGYADRGSTETENKPVMEENVLYGYGDPGDNHADNIPVMMDNVLYTSAGAENSPEKLVMEDNVLYQSSRETN